MNKICRLASFASLVMWIASGAVGAQELKKIRIGYPSLSFRQSNVWVAKEMGLFSKYGLEVEPIFLRGGQMATQALVGGDPPIVNIGTVIQASLRGHNLVLVAAVETNYDQIVFARPEITRLEQLKGKRFGVSGFGSATHYASTILVKHMKPYPTLKGIQFMLEMLAPTMPEAKNAKPEQFVDLSFLQELEKEGFFTEMAKQYPSKS